jgi:uncharacterized protein with FMN-binding domain
MGKRKNFRRILVVVLILILGISTIFFISLRNMLQSFSNEVNKIEVSQIDLQGIKDGVYTGEYYFNESVGAKVKVTVENNKIISIEFIEHKYGRGKKAEVITDKVIEKQSLNVDVISGATGSSKIILKAIENALSKGLSK